MRSKVLVIPMGMVLLASLAFAQNATPAQRINGVIATFDGSSLAVKTQDGQTVTVAVPADLKVFTTQKSSLTEIKPGDFVASAAIDGPDGKPHSQELRIFPEEMRGRGEGHRPMAADPNAPGNRTMTNATVTAVAPVNRTMTNATVTNVSGGSQGVVLKVQYKDGETELVVGPETPVTRMVVADRSLLKPGTTVAVNAAKSDSGLTATNLNIVPAKQ